MSQPDEITRRRALHAGLTVMALPALLGAALDGTEVGFRLIETAGLCRFGFPVHAVLPRPPANSGTNFRLTRDRRPVPAQFREVTRDGKPAIALDFNASPGPLVTETYAVHFGDGVEPGPEPKGGIRFERVGPDFRVSAFTVPGDLLGFLKRASFGKTEYVAEGSEGLIIRLRDGTLLRLGSDSFPLKATIDREGPMAVGLRFEGTRQTLRSTAQLTFPNSKSWVETVVAIEDPELTVAAVGVDLSLRVEGPPTLVDLGANSTVYAALKGREAMELAAGSAPDHGRTWIVRKGPPGALTAFAESSAPNSTPAEGWAHVMDKTRCTALAVANFGRTTRDRIEVDATGRVRIWREFASGGEVPSGKTKSLKFWFHFVNMPVQVGAATSPQAMLAPLQVAW